MIDPRVADSFAASIGGGVVDRLCQGLEPDPEAFARLGVGGRTLRCPAAGRRRPCDLWLRDR